MSFATDTLTKAQAAYQNALTGKLLQHNGKRLEQHEIKALLDQVIYWEGRVAAETARAAGQSSRQPIRFNL